MRTQHVFDRRNLDRGRNACCGPWNHESYKGDYLIELASVIDVQMHRKAIGACSVIHARSRTRQSFRRSRAHIREDATDVVVLCFIKHGRLRLEHEGGEVEAKPGDFLVATSIAPFFVECGVDHEETYEALHLIVPTHVVREHLGRDLAAGFCIPAAGRNFGIAARILAELVEDQGDIGEIAAQRLVDAALATIADAIRRDGSCSLQPPSRADLRMRAVLRHIELHLSDPALSVSSVARACCVSPRYIFSLFQRQGMTFSTVLWSKRLNAAAQRLSTSSAASTTISEIAYRAGFKSAAHFTRMFKREYKKSPRAFRASAVRTDDAHSAPVRVQPASMSRH